MVLFSTFPPPPRKLLPKIINHIESIISNIILLWFMSVLFDAKVGC